MALTAWQALVERGNVQPGQKVLIHAGAGGVGSIAIQLAKHLGATVATTASASNADFVRDLGADIVIDYRTQDFEQLLHGYDLVLDSLGGENLEKSLRILKPGGKAIGIAGPPDPAFAREAGLNPVLRLAIAGAQQPDPAAGEEARRELRVPLHARQRRPAAPDHRPGRRRRAAPGRRARSSTSTRPRRRSQSLAKGGIRGKAVVTHPA